MVRGQTRTIEIKAREIQISEADWEATPASVKKLVEALMEEVAQLNPHSASWRKPKIVHLLYSKKGDREEARNRVRYSGPK
jgi:hypothetical protein